MAKKKVEDKINLDSILFNCRDILRQARNSGSFFEKRDMMRTLVFLRFIGEKFEDGVQKLRQELIAQGQDAWCVQADVADRQQAFDAVHAVLRLYRRIDALINNAAISQQMLFTDISEEDWDRMFAVNVKGAFHCTQAALPNMISRRSGAIVNISSMWGQVGASCEVHYSASKAAVIGFTQALAKEVGPSMVRVNCIAPGVIDTDMNAHLDEETMSCLADETPLMRIGSPDEVARAALFLCSENASFITGQVLGVNGGYII